ncbi:PIN domain-containing protein [Kitasatospora phosalacinea]|uniref:PIN domain-containing protein n=1 Tax=Kitasatospora phosalacinea TaxID=2065 RepID=A0A9W6UPU0_9ACTN|nr:PIN domain-containing protein [Kitasatospora phosalacinea]GLW57851.1 hypothetical protein Kpho01_58620 [Kitasatospora phosalacinea]
MQLSLLPGTNRDNALTALTKVTEKVTNLYTGSGHYDAGGLLLAYLEWASDAVYSLEGVVSPADLDRLILTRRHDQLLAGAADLGAAHLMRVTNQLVQLELSQRSRALQAAVEDLQASIRKWNRWDSYDYVLVFDTSVFIHHPEQLQDIKFHSLLGAPYCSYCLIVPMVVIDELDRLKEAGKDHTRWRARHSLRIIDSIFEDSHSTTAVLHGQSEEERLTRRNPEQRVTVELLVDPPQHVRLPDPDDEIVDRTLAVQPLVDDRVTLFTYDTGLASRARIAKLPYMKLSTPPEPEPSAPVKKAGRQRNRPMEPQQQKQPAEGS